MGFLMGHSAWQIDQFPTCWPMNGLFVHWSRGWGMSSFSERLVLTEKLPTSLSVVLFLGRKDTHINAHTLARIHTHAQLPPLYHRCCCRRWEALKSRGTKKPWATGIRSATIRITSCQNTNFVVTGGTGGCYNDNLRCSPVSEDKVGVLTTRDSQCSWSCSNNTDDLLLW